MLAERSGEVLGRTKGDGLTGAKVGSAEIGSVFSSDGVAFGELSLGGLNQKCFFLVEGLVGLVGLVELVGRLGDADADTGLLATASSPGEILFFSKLAEPGVAASAVLGRRLGLPSSLVRTKVGADCVGGLAAAKELILPVREWVPRIVELLPSVSDEIKDKGRGMTSTVSEKPTRGRTPGALSRRTCGEVAPELLLEGQTG